MEEIYKELTEKFHSNPIFVCRNNGNCKGWFCSACKEWHPYGTCCSVEMVHDMRRGSNTAFLREATTILSQLVPAKEATK
jgi:hypothetical protein